MKMVIQKFSRLLLYFFFTLVLTAVISQEIRGQQTQKPVLHGKHWMAITGKPLGATAGAMIFQQGGNAVDAACAMLAATCTMWDVLSWGGETQDQNLLQFFLNMVEFDMNVQQAVEAPNINSYQMQAAFGNHEIKPGALTLQSETPSWVRRDLQNRGYKMDFRERTSGPITAIWFDWKHGTLWGGASNHGEDYGIGW